MSGEQGESRTEPPIPLGQAFRWGFIVGTVVLILALMLALFLPIGEALLPYVGPGSLVVGALGDATADWPGLLTVALAAVINGAIYGVVVLGIALALNLVRRP